MNTVKTSVCRCGSNQGIRLPEAVLDIVGINDGEVALSIVRDSIVIKKAAKTAKCSYPSLSERFSAYTGDYVPEEWNVGKLIGKEF